MPNEPAPTAPFTDEDRARVETMIRTLERSGAWFHRKDSGSAARNENERADSLTRALAYITHLEGALGAADELARVVRRFGKTTGSLSTWREVYDTASRYEAARTRATLPTSKEGE